VDYRKGKGSEPAEIRVQTVLDDSARTRLGLDIGGTVTGPVPIKLSGQISGTDGVSRLAVDADFTQAKITELFPGWIKPAGKPVRASFILVEKEQVQRFEDLSIEGSGARVKGSVEFGSDGELVSANFSSFALADGDKATFKAERGSDGTLKATLRGDVFDGRGFVKSVLAGSSLPNARRPAFDLDLDVKLGAVAGFNGEALRSLELHLARRAGELRSFSLGAKLGRDAALSGDMRARGRRTILNLETGDAGALFRFSDMYPRMIGGQMWVEMDPPAADRRPADGRLSVRNFLVSGEAALDRMAAGTMPGDPGAAYAPARNQGVQFARMRADFTRDAGRLIIRDGVVSGPAIGATIDGQIDFQRDDVRLRGTIVPAYALNNIPAQLPILGVFLGGGRNEGFLGVTYEVVGRPNAMTLRVNPISAVAPGFLRKLFEFRNTDDQAWTGSVPRSDRPN
jgi:hypothetical protein